MTVDPLILLQPRLPGAEDPEVREFLGLCRSAMGARWIELTLEVRGSSDRGVYCSGERTGELQHLALGLIDSFSAFLRVGGARIVTPEMANLAAALLVQILEKRKMREQTMLLSGALESTASAVILFDASGQIVYSNPKADQLMAHQTESELAVVREGGKRQPLFAVLCSVVEEVIASPELRSSWSGTLVLADQRCLKGEILKLRLGPRGHRIGVLVQLAEVDSGAQRHLGVFALEYQLSPREEEVLEMIQAGLAIPKVAVKLGISPHTVRDHIKHLYRKTGASSRIELLSKLTRSPV